MRRICLHPVDAKRIFWRDTLLTQQFFAPAMPLRKMSMIRRSYFCLILKVFE